MTRFLLSRCLRGGLLTGFLASAYGCSGMHVVHKVSCTDTSDCNRSAMSRCEGPYSIISRTRGDPDDQDWEREGATTVGNIIFNATDMAANEMSGKPYVIKYQC